MLTTLDLCSGVGGCSLAFHNAGFKTTFACDIEPKCKITYDLNFTKPKLTTEDLYNISPSHYQPFDVLVAGFPCQSFSLAGKRLGFQDGDRGNVFFQLADILRIQKPKAFLFENVKGLLNHDNGNTLKTIQETIHSLGYSLHYKVLNTKNYGLPQNRERIFLVGFNKAKYGETSFDFPTPVPLKLTIQDLLDKPTDASLHINPEHKHYQSIVDGVTKEDTVYQWRRSYVRENKSKVCPTITASIGGVLNLVKQGDVIRQLSPRELFRFQGFPDTYKLPPELSYADLHHQAGNSVSVCVVEAIAKNIHHHLND